MENPITLVPKSLRPHLLLDCTLNSNIILATSTYPGYESTAPITADMLSLIIPRVCKAKEVQNARKKKKAEVFTPSWICASMNNYLDEDWFGKPNIFNFFDEKTHSWTPNPNPIPFENEAAWQKYVDSTRLEITCGEAPFLVSRYDTTTGDPIPLASRIGLLDRKLRVVKENAHTEEDWLKWSERALRSIYGYEYQGDNLMIARSNVLLTMMDYLRDALHREPTLDEMAKWVCIIRLNLVQMDGLTYRSPANPDIPTLIADWEASELFPFEDMAKEG